MEKQVNMKKPWREKVKMDNNSKGKKWKKTIKNKRENKKNHKRQK